MSALLKLKICGLKHPQNIRDIVSLSPDFVGFIFYEKSPRYVGNLPPEEVRNIPASIKKTGVFVNAPKDVILEQAKAYDLDVIQLHGDETTQVVKELKAAGLSVIKVFRVRDELPNSLADFEGLADLFLFDTKAKAYGGTGHQFDWSILKNYALTTPYLLSGGVSVNDIETIRNENLPGMMGIDVNSKFEIEPGLKNIELLKKLKQTL